MYKIYYSRKVFALLNDHPSYGLVSWADNSCGRKTTERLVEGVAHTRYLLDSFSDGEKLLSTRAKKVVKICEHNLQVTCTLKRILPRDSLRMIREKL